MEARKQTMTTISDRQRQAIVDAMLDAAKTVNAGGHPGDAIRAMLATVKSVAGSEPQAPPASAPGLSLVHMPAQSKPIALTEVPEPLASPKRKAEAEIAQRVFLYWMRAVSKPGSKFTRERQSKIMARLRDGYTEQDMFRAIDGICSSDHHRGINDTGTQYLDLTLVLRDGSHLERFRDMAPDKMTRTVTSDPKADELVLRIERLKVERARALQEGRTDDYQQHVRSIRAAEKELSATRRTEV